MRCHAFRRSRGRFRRGDFVQAGSSAISIPLDTAVISRAVHRMLHLRQRNDPAKSLPYDRERKPDAISICIDAGVHPLANRSIRCTSGIIALLEHRAPTERGSLVSDNWNSARLEQFRDNASHKISKLAIGQHKMFTTSPDQAPHADGIGSSLINRSSLGPRGIGGSPGRGTRGGPRSLCVGGPPPVGLPQACTWSPEPGPASS